MLLLGEILFLSSLIWEIFTLALTNGFPTEFDWQQVSSSPQDFFQYSGQSQQCCSSDDLHSSSYFQVLQFLNQSVGDCTKRVNYNWVLRSLSLSIVFIFQFSWKVLVLISLFTFFKLEWQSGQPGRQSPFFSGFNFSFLGLVAWLRLGDPFVSQNPREVLWVTFLRTDSGLCIHHLFVNSVWSYNSLLGIIIIVINIWPHVTSLDQP